MNDNLARARSNLLAFMVGVLSFGGAIALTLCGSDGGLTRAFGVMLGLALVTAVACRMPGRAMAFLTGGMPSIPAALLRGVISPARHSRPRGDRIQRPPLPLDPPCLPAPAAPPSR